MSIYLTESPIGLLQEFTGYCYNYKKTFWHNGCL